MSFHFFERSCFLECTKSLLNLLYPNVSITFSHVFSTISMFFELNCHFHFMDCLIDDFFFVIVDDTDLVSWKILILVPFGNTMACV